MLVLETPRFLGRAGFGLYEPTDEPELGYALRPDDWGNGYALEAAIGLRDLVQFYRYRREDWHG